MAELVRGIREPLKCSQVEASRRREAELDAEPLDPACTVSLHARVDRLSLHARVHRRSASSRRGPPSSVAGALGL